MNPWQESNNTPPNNVAATSERVSPYGGIPGGQPQPVAPPHGRVEYWTPAATRRQGPGFWRELFGVAVDRATWGALLYMVLSLATGTVLFTVVVTGLSLSGGLAVLIVGIPFLIAFMAAVRGLAFLEGRLVEALLGTKILGRSSEPGDLTFKQRIRFWFKDRRTWTAMLYMLLQLPLGIYYFTVAVAGLAVGGYMVVASLMQAIGGHTYITYGDPSTEFLFRTWQLPLLFVVGCLVILAWMHVCRAIGRGHAAYARRMLGRAPSQPQPPA